MKVTIMAENKDNEDKFNDVVKDNYVGPLSIVGGILIEHVMINKIND